MGILKNHFLLIIIIFGVLIRLIAVTFPGFKFDMDAWFAWALRLNQVGFSNFYSEEIWTNYTPGFLYILAILGFIKNIFSIPDTIFYYLLKIPSLLSEIIIGIFVYKIISKQSVQWAKIAALSIFLNPAFIFNSSVWGQIDGILSLCLLLSVYFLNRLNLIASSLFLGLALLIKPQAILIFPVFAIFLVKNLSINNILKLILPCLLTIFLLSLPFFPSQPVLGFPFLILEMLNDYPYISLYAYNFWGMIGFWISDHTLWNKISYQNWGYILFVFYWLIILYFYFKKKLSIFTLAVIASLSLYFLPTRVHDRYLYPSLIFLIFLSSLLKSRLLMILTITLSILHCLNLYYVYVYYNELYLKMPKILYDPIIYNFLDNYGYALSALSTFIFILISINIIKYDSKKT